MKKHRIEGFQQMLHEKAARNIAGMIIRLQTVWSSKLGKFAEKYAIKKQKTFFICFFALTLTGNAWMTLSSLKKEKARYHTPEIAKIPFSVIEKSTPVWDTTGLYNAEKFLSWFDRLEKTAEGKRQRDSIESRRPGLVDSIRTWVKQAR